MPCNHHDHTNVTEAFIGVPIITQCYQVFSYMIEMLLDHRLDSARQVHSSRGIWS